MTILNSSFEVGLRSAILLSQVYPRVLDLNRLVLLDHVLLHTADAGGPESLLPPLPNRIGELGLKRTLIERGIEIMVGAGLIEQKFGSEGIEYQSTDSAAAVLGLLESTHAKQIESRAVWISEQFIEMGEVDLRNQLQQTFERWAEEFDSRAVGDWGQV